MNKKNKRRSKSEVRLCKLLTKKYPQLQIIANDHKICNGLELDIVIPELKLAIEWNGPIHRKPIYGKLKFQEIKTNDKTKKKIISSSDYMLIIVNDMDSKKPLQYSKQVYDFVNLIISKDKITPTKIIEIELKDN
jgi:hypothetical protein